MKNDNVFIQALQELGKFQIQHGECSVTFTFHDGRIQFYTISSNERHNIASLKKQQELTDGKSA